MNNEVKKFCVHNDISINPSVVIKELDVEYFKNNKLAHKGFTTVSFPIQHTDYSTQINIDLNTDIFHTGFSDSFQNINFDEELLQELVNKETHIEL